MPISGGRFAYSQQLWTLMIVLLTALLLIDSCLAMPISREELSEADAPHHEHHKAHHHLHHSHHPHQNNRRIRQLEKLLGQLLRNKQKHDQYQFDGFLPRPG